MPLRQKARDKETSVMSSKTRNKLTDLNNILFEQLERLNDESLKGEALEEEISRAKSIAGISTNIINNASVILRAAEFKDNRMNLNIKAPELLIGDVSNE